MINLKPDLNNYLHQIELNFDGIIKADHVIRITKCYV